MIICSNCFCDTEIRSRIESRCQKGLCRVCNKSDAFIYDTEKEDYLKGIFDNIINIYTPTFILPKGSVTARQTFLKDELLKNWTIFNELSSEQVYSIVKELSPDLYQESPDMFDSPIANMHLDDLDYLKENSMLKEFDWSQFVQALKHENRFHTNYMNTQILDVFCSYIRKPYKTGIKFYRGRISSASGFKVEDMSAPPEEKSLDGRANSAGVCRLYLANDEETTVHEIRAGAFDYITIGCFELQRDITVVDLKMINKISPFIEGLDALQYFINKEHLNKINIEMGRALRRSDGPLDYLPTQYIADFIQSITHNGKHEYDGIEYQSTLNPSGYNLAIFHPELFDCVSVKTYQIKELKYKKDEI